MARGHVRTPSPTAYRGALGRTQTAIVHVTGADGDLIAATVHTTIDAVSDPELVERFYAGTLNTTTTSNGPVPLAVPLLYHDPAAELLALVLGEGDRHRELDERIRFLERLRADGAPVPLYVKELVVVFGPVGLRKYIEDKAQSVMSAAGGTKELERKRAELAARETELDRDKKRFEQLQDDYKRSKAELDRSRTEHDVARAEQKRAQAELERSKAELERSKAELERNKVELERNKLELERSKGELERMRSEARARVIAAVAEPATTIAPAPSRDRDDVVTMPIGRQDIADIETSLQAARPVQKGEFEIEAATRIDARALQTNGARPNSELQRAAEATSFDDSEKTGDDGKVPGELEGVELDDEPTGNSAMPAGSDPLTTLTTELPPESDAGRTQASSFSVGDGRARLVLVAGEQIASGLVGDLDVRILLHRVSSYPVIALLIGPPAAMRTPSPTQLAVLPLDIGADGDRAIVSALAKRFELTVDIVVHGRAIRRVRLSAPLAENVAYILRAAEDHLRGIAADGETEPSYTRARDLVLGAGYDLLGVEHAEATEFRDDKLTQLNSAQNVRRAVAIARRFARPSREDYLVCARGYPLSRWRELRRLVLETAVAWGIWLGPELAQIAVSEGLARSRRDLIMRLDAGFESLRRNEAAFDIDADAADDNAKAIAEEARALGVELRARKSNGAIKSDDLSVVSGSIERTPTGSISIARSIDDLIALLDDKVQRVQAATELCDRGDPRAATPVIAAVRKMSRAEAVRILGKAVKFGSAAAPPLIEGLASSKAFLRHGCALALALLRTDDGTHAVIELLISEPTEIWREIARAIGQIGPTALMPLASHVGRMGEQMTPALQERVAWAMAHVGVRGGKSALDQMAAGQSVMAPIARQALALHANAARDEVRVRPGGQSNKDVTVNRAFSRRFFEALEADRPDVAQAALHDLDASGPLEVLDEADLIVDEEEDEAELDESDLIQT